MKVEEVDGITSTQGYGSGVSHVRAMVEVLDLDDAVEDSEWLANEKMFIHTKKHYGLNLWYDLEWDPTLDPTRA